MAATHQWFDEIPSFDLGIEDSEDISKLIVEDSLEKVGDNSHDEDDEVTFNGIEGQAFKQNLDLNKVPEEILPPTTERFLDLDQRDVDLNKLPAVDLGVEKEEVKDMMMIYLDYINIVYVYVLISVMF
ncbi:hypothetical protein QL285_015714 [Trifolium repens]|nr:hypothetical protein QL285_015714 [Trifolium repens]